LKVRRPLSLMRDDDGMLRAALWLRGLHVISKLDRPTHAVNATHRSGTSGYRWQPNPARHDHAPLG
jgi:hypothetical protein